MTSSAKVQSIVRAALKKRFPKMRVAEIQLTEDMDEDGHRLIEIRVIYDGTENDFDTTGVLELPRLIMPELSKANEPSFPIFSFISKSDWLSPEAA